MRPPDVTRIRVVDSHTAGEPTRVVLDGGPDLGSGTLAERRARFLREFDRYRAAVVNEPRGSDPVVGALLCPPSDPSCAAGVIFFNNVGGLGMCGHGTIGLVATLAWLGRIGPGSHRIETPVGVVAAELHASGEVSVQNVPSYRHLANVTVETEGHTLVQHPELREEVFGPATVLVRCPTRARVLDVARGLEGQLTTTIHGTAEDLAAAGDLLALLETKAGRIVFDGFPTGVEVCAAMVHGGPFPATSDGRSTSVGTRAIARFVRPVCFQGFPEEALPDELRDDNPLAIRRLVDGR